MPGRHDPRRAVHIHADILRRHRQRLTGMHTHPHPQHTLLRPLHRRQAPLRLTCGRNRLARRLERNQERITLFVDLIAAMPRERLPQQPPMQGERFREPLRPQPLQQQRRSLHIREQQRHRPRRLHHHQTTIARGRGPASADFAPRRGRKRAWSCRRRPPPREVGPEHGTPRRGCSPRERQPRSRRRDDVLAAEGL